MMAEVDLVSNEIQQHQDSIENGPGKENLIENHNRINDVTFPLPICFVYKTCK